MEGFSKTEATTTVKASMGTPVTLFCQDSPGPSNRRQTSWFRENSIEIRSDHDFGLQTDGSLVINEVVPENAHKYKCETNQENFRTRRFMVVKIMDIGM